MADAGASVSKNDPFAGFATPVQGQDPFAGVASPVQASAPAPAAPQTPVSKALQFWQGIKNAASYAHDVFQTPGYAVGKAMDAASSAVGINTPQQENFRRQLAAFQQQKAADQAKVGGAHFLTDVVANPLTYALGPVGSEAAPAGMAAMSGTPRVLGSTLAAKAGQGAAIGNAFTTLDPSATPGGVALGTALGGAVPLVAKAVSKVAGWVGDKAADALAGTKLGDRLGIKTQLNPKYAGAPELSAELDQAGIKHTVGDITSDPKVMSYEAGMARRDPRMMDLRVQQNQQATAYAEKVVNDLKAEVQSAGWKNLDQVKAAAEAGGKRSGAAKALLTAIENSGDDWKKIAQNSGNLQLMVEKLKADQLYDKAEGIAALFGPVKTTRTLGSAKAAVSSLEGEIGADSPNAPHMLKDIVQKIEDGNQYSFSDLRRLRTKLNDKIAKLSDPKSVSPPLDVELNAYKNVVKAVEDDLDKYANGHSSGLRNAWKQATDHYRDKVVPYKDSEMGKILADQDPLALGRLFSGKDKYAQQRMFGLMGPKGQAAVRSGIIEDAISAGEKTQRGAMAPTMSAARAASALEKLDANGTLDVAFKGGDKWAARGLARLLRTVDKSDNIAWIPPTGESAERLGSVVRGDTTLLGVGEKAANWLNKERLFRLYTDPKGRALLIRASDLQPGSKEMQDLIQIQLPKVLGANVPKNIVPFHPATPAAASMADAPRIAQATPND